MTVSVERAPESEESLAITLIQMPEIPWTRQQNIRSNIRKRRERLLILSTEPLRRLNAGKIQRKSESNTLVTRTHILSNWNGGGGTIWHMKGKIE